MTKVTPKNIRLFSLVFHGSLSAILVLGLLIITSPSHNSNNDLILLWFFSVMFACLFGWVFGSWYIPEKGNLFVEPYIVTPLISLLSAISTVLLFSVVKELLTDNQNIFNVIIFFSSSLLLGIYAFLLTLPITIIIGTGMASYLYKFDGYKNAL